MPSFPVVSIELTEAEREQLESWSRRRTTAQALAQRSRIVLLVAEGLRTGEVAERLGVHRNTVAKWRRRFEAERLDGLVDEPRPGRPRTITDAMVDEVITKTLGERAEGRDALVDAVDGGRGRAHAVGGAPDLAGVRAATAPRGDVQAQPRSAVRGQGQRRRRAVSEPARARGRALRGREVPDPGAGSHPADPADAARAARARDPRLQAPRHLQPLRRAGHQHRQGDRLAAQPPSRDRVQAVPADARSRGPGRARRARRSSTTARTHKTPAIQQVADRAPALRAALHPDLRQLAEPRRALVRRADQQEAPPRRAPLRPRSSTPTSAPGSKTWNDDPKPSSGPRPPTRSSNPSPATAHESTNHDTSAVEARGELRSRSRSPRGRGARAPRPRGGSPRRV